MNDSCNNSNLNKRRGLIKKHSKTYQTLQKLNWEGHNSRTSGILTVQQIYVYSYEIIIISKTLKLLVTSDFISRPIYLIGNNLSFVKQFHVLC